MGPGIAITCGRAAYTAQIAANLPVRGAIDRAPKLHDRNRKEG
jgi:hypothetical protein